MPPKMNDGGFVSYDDMKFYIRSADGTGFDYLPDNWSETVTAIADTDEEYKPIYGDWSFFNTQCAKISDKSWARFIVGDNKSMMRRIIRHMEWWRRYALKTGAKRPEVYQCLLEITGRAFRPKMPQGRKDTSD